MKAAFAIALAACSNPHGAGPDARAARHDKATTRIEMAPRFPDYD